MAIKMSRSVPECHALSRMCHGLAPARSSCHVQVTPRQNIFSATGCQIYGLGEKLKIGMSRPYIKTLSLLTNPSGPRRQ